MLFYTFFLFEISSPFWYNSFKKANNLIYLFIFHYNFIRSQGSLYKEILVHLYTISPYKYRKTVLVLILNHY